MNEVEFPYYEGYDELVKLLESLPLKNEYNEYYNDWIYIYIGSNFYTITTHVGDEYFKESYDFTNLKPLYIFFEKELRSNKIKKILNKNELP